MFINEINLLGFSSLLEIPITKLLINTLLVAIGMYVFVKFIVSKHKFVKITAILISTLIFVLYFGLSATVILLIIFSGSMLLGEKIYKFDDLIISFIAGFFTFIGAYILLAVILNFVAALVAVLLVSLGLLLFKRDNNKKIWTKLKKDFNFYLNTFNVIDYWAISLAFIVGSLPQGHWDAIHANLYNVKWYISNNSFSPLIESISSLFPQNAIGYYSLFYQSGGTKTLQIAYILPLLMLIFLFKKISRKLKFSKLSSMFGYLIIFTPIVIFQSSSGYYDLLITLILVSVIYILYFQPSKSLEVNTLVASYLVGFAAAVKFFPLVMIFLPIINYIINKKVVTTKTVLVGLFSILLGLFPLAVWLLRSYLFTGSPVFPFYQAIFPTPDYWTGTELADNFMIQTSMGLLEWIKGGLFLYPILTFINTDSFIEATQGYPGITYIILLPVQIIIFVSIIRRSISKKLEKRDTFYLYTFFAYLLIGLIARYYRYLWPFQFTFSLITLFYLSEAVDRLKSGKVIIVSIIVVVLLININSLLGYYRFFPISPERYFQPGYLVTTKDTNHPITFINNNLSANRQETILDISQHTLPRFHINAKTYECNWYWINGITKMEKAVIDKNYAKELIRDFDYVITSNPVSPVNNYCDKVVSSNMDLLTEIYRDDSYFVFKVE